MKKEIFLSRNPQKIRTQEKRGKIWRPGDLRRKAKSKKIKGRGVVDRRKEGIYSHVREIGHPKGRGRTEECREKLRKPYSWTI